MKATVALSVKYALLKDPVEPNRVVTVDELLLAEIKKLPSCNEVGSFNSSGGAKSPA